MKTHGQIISGSKQSFTPEMLADIVYSAVNNLGVYLSKFPQGCADELTYEAAEEMARAAGATRSEGFREIVANVLVNMQFNYEYGKSELELMHQITGVLR